MAVLMRTKEFLKKYKYLAYGEATNGDLGIVKSMDGGNTWNFASNINLVDIEYITEDKLVAIGTNPHGIYRSDNRGKLDSSV